MGWSSWNAYKCDISEDIIKGNADRLIELGLRDLGYQYVVVDDCWQERNGRDESGRIITNNKTFPSGIKPLSHYMHSHGLRFGIYSDAGKQTCQGRPGGLGYEDIDARTYAQWGVDFVKYDNCWNGFLPYLDRYGAMRDALNRTGRLMVYSTCEKHSNPWEWGADMSNQWRIGVDLFDTWESLVRVADDGIGIAHFSGPGGWNDFDLLQVGNGGMQFQEYRAQFAVWSIVKSPLMISTDLFKISPRDLSTLKARELIAVNQDPLAIAGDVVRQQGPDIVYGGPLADGSRAAVMWNRRWHFNWPLNDCEHPSGNGTSSTPGLCGPLSVGRNMTLRFEWLGGGSENRWPNAEHFHSDTRALVRDLYEEGDLGIFTGEVTLLVPNRGVRALRVTPVHQVQHASSTSTSNRSFRQQASRETTEIMM